MEADKAVAGSSSSPMEYIRESLGELKKVHSPTRAETIQATLVTVFIMVFIALVLFVFDFVFRTLIHSLVA